MSPPDAAHRLAAHAAGLRFADIPPEAVDKAKTFILDTLGVGIAGGSVPEAAPLLAAARGWGEGSAARVWGSRARLAPGATALVNGFQVHCQEFDNLHEGAVLHSMATLLPVLLAEAESRPVSGEDLIAAVVAGVDVACSLGLAARQGWRFFRPATSGGFGAVAGLARLRGYDAARTLAAFGMQLGQASGTMQAHTEGSPLLPLQIGFNARAAMQSCDLAAAGFPGLDAPFEGRFGYLPLFEGAWDCTEVLDALGRTWRVTELSHKPFPSGRATHGGVDALMALQAAHGFAAEEVESITIAAPPLINQLVNRPALPAPGAAYARLCLPFVLAKLLQHGRIELAQFRGAALADPVTYDLARRVTVTRVDDPNPNALLPQVMEVRLRDGRVLTHRVDQMLASPARPLPREAHLSKFRACWTYAAEPLDPASAEALIGLVDRLETLPDVSALLVPLTPA
ncbi:MmgE/PrpD family protein [Paracraurococcus lichenis]|uniref:MmgE/PrpD family protein n=1 Tax=Paracraurococcus lichenis TaxID=3064888 RepID=A0ABT9DSD3_9PROT|nr:MmgE/PrpD family protein [Paracraurococcus sp. LOR1-02]MDO9706807.1 MmgE/PrpD family protein [Paracraurococcus sp. LOR1-02]